MKNRAKKWCSICKNTERNRRKSYFREFDQEKLNEYEKMQQKLFQEALNNKNFNTVPETEAPNEPLDRFLSSLIEESADQIFMEPSLMEYAINYMMSTPEDDLLEIL